MAACWPRPACVCCITSCVQSCCFGPLQRVRTWLRSDAATTDKAGLAALIDDTAHLARLEGLYGHEAAALARKSAL